MCILHIIGHIILDVCAYEKGNIYADFLLDSLDKTDVKGVKPKSRRYVLPLNDGIKMVFIEIRVSIII